MSAAQCRAWALILFLSACGQPPAPRQTSSWITQPPPASAEGPAPAPPAVDPDVPPAADTDRDGIADINDACPAAPGVPTEDPRTNGCPRDTDRDGIPDKEDACLQEPGLPSTSRYQEGCPRFAVIREPWKCFVDESILFGTSSALTPEAEQALAQQAKFIRQHPEITAVLVSGHSQNLGDTVIDDAVARRRAEVVLEWLTDKKKGGLSPSLFSLKVEQVDRCGKDDDGYAVQGKKNRVQLIARDTKVVLK